PYFPRMEQTFTLATPGQEFTLTAHLYNRGKVSITPQTVRLELPEGWSSSIVKEERPVLNAGDSATVQFKITVPANAKYTRPYWSRRDPQAENIYTISDPKLRTLPLPPYPVHAVANFSTPAATTTTNVWGK